MTRERSGLAHSASLGLPYEGKRVVRRALMRLQWRLFVGRQVEFNRAVAGAVEELARTVSSLEKRLDELEVASPVGTSARAQLYDLEGSLRRDLSAVQIELARLQERSAP